MSMKVERSTVDQVKRRFEMLKKKKDEKNKEYDLSERIQELKEEVLKCEFFVLLFQFSNYRYQEEKMREYRREKKKERKRKHDDDDDQPEMNDEMAAMMGFSGFGSSKKAN